MLIQCPDCKQKHLIRTGDRRIRYGAKLLVYCKCGTRLRFTYRGPARELPLDVKVRSLGFVPFSLNQAIRDFFGTKS